MALPLVNGQAYDYTQIVVNILGVEISGVSSINYTQEQPKTNNYGTGNNPVNRGRGAKECSASFELSMNEVEALRDIAPNGSLLDIPSFDISVTFGNAQKVVTHTIKNAEFSNDGVETSQGDTDIRRTFDLTPSHILYR